MGLRWECRQPPLQSLEKEHWDAQAFAEFFSGHGRSSVMSSGNPNGSHHSIKEYIPMHLDPVAEKTKEVVIQAIEAAIIAAVATGSTTLVITLPSWVPIAVLVLVLGEVARRQIWRKDNHSKLMNIRLVCPTHEMFEAINRYFQGTWELP
jgi:hypothetical protein